MPKEHFDKIDQLIEQARKDPTRRGSAIRGLRGLHKTFTGHLRFLDSQLRKFDKQPPVRGYEEPYINTREDFGMNADVRKPS